MKNIAETVLPMVREVRGMLLPHWGKVESRHKNGDLQDPVTDLDERIEEYLTESLKKIDPSAGFVGEEFGGDRNADRFWLGDPIDGTVHFIRGLRGCTTMLALIEDGQVNFAVIYDFVNDVMYHAERGKGAYRSGERLQVSDRPLKQSYLSYATHMEKSKNYERYLKMQSHARLIRTSFSGYFYALIAEGKLDGRVVFDGYGGDWDYAPGSLLVEEAGGKVGNIGKTAYDFRDHDHIAANPRVYESLTRGPAAIFPIT